MKLYKTKEKILGPVGNDRYETLYEIREKMLKQIFLIIIFPLFSLSCAGDPAQDQNNSSQEKDDPYRDQRNRMVNHQIEDRGVRNEAVLTAMRSVKRHLFVPEDEIENAYRDSPLPIGYGQTISQPYIVAYMTEVIKPEPEHKVLEIGTGSGYQAAVLAEIVDSVFTIEIVAELGKSAAERLKKLAYNNVQVKISDGYFGWKEHASFDAIVVTAAAEYIPPPLIEQLKDGGKMVIPVGAPFRTQLLMLVEKKGEKVITHSLFPVRFVPFRRSD